MLHSDAALVTCNTWLHVTLRHSISNVQTRGTSSLYIALEFWDLALNGDKHHEIRGSLPQIAKEYTTQQQEGNDHQSPSKR